jgi:hypothetical protein
MKETFVFRWLAPLVAGLTALAGGHGANAVLGAGNPKTIVQPKWGPDSVGEAELVARHDPTFAGVSRHFPMLQDPREASGVPESPTEFSVLPDGSLEFGNFPVPECNGGVPPENKATAMFVVGQKPKRFGKGITADAKRLVEGYLPMVIVPYADEGLRYPDKAGLYLDSLAVRVHGNGEFKTSFGFCDAGSLLVAFYDHYRFTRDESWLRRTAPTIARMCDWIVRRRAKEKAGQDPAATNYGLIKYTSSADYPTPDYSYISDASLYVGLEAAAEALHAAGWEEAARRAGEEATAYRRDVLASMDRAIFDNAGQRLLPILPASRGWLEKADYGSYGYYALFASMLLDTEFLPANDPRAVLLTRALERRGGLLASVCAFGPPHRYPPPMLNHGFTYGYRLTALNRGEPKRAILGLYSSLAFGITRSTYGGVETTCYATGRHGLTIPHLRSGTQQLRLLRAMLVREDGQRLLLAQAAPQQWFRPGQQLEVLDAPTTFGKLSHTIAAAADGGQITVSLLPPRRNPPQEIRVFVRHPVNKPIRRESAGGKPLTSFDAGSVALRDCGAPVRLELHY